MAFIYGMIALIAVVICIILTEKKGEEWIGGIVAFPSACFYGYAAMKLASLGASNVLVVAMGILSVILPTYLYHIFYRTLPTIRAVFHPKVAEDNRSHEVSLASNYGEKLLQRSKEWEGAFRLFELKSDEKIVERPVVKERKRKMVDVRPDAIVERGGKSKGVENRKRAEDEALRLIQEVKRSREQKVNPKLDIELDYSYKEMMEQGDLLWNNKIYLLAKKLYEECMNRAKSQEEKRLAELKIERCELEARRESQHE